MCDRIAVFNEGRIEQVGDARERLRAARERRSSPASSASRTCSSATAAASPSAPEKVRLLDGRRSGRRARRRGGRDRRRLLRAGWSTRYHVALDGGDGLQVAAAEPRADFTRGRRKRGRRVKVGWRREHTVAVAEQHGVGDINRGGAMSSDARSARWAWLAVAGLSVVIAAFAIGCGSSDSSDSDERRWQRCSSRGRQGRGRARTSIAWAGYAEDGSTDPEGRLGHAVREADRLPGQRQDRQHLRRDGAADADRPVRRRLGVRRRHAAPDRRRRRRAGQHRPRAQLRRHLPGAEGPAVQLASTAKMYGIPHGRGRTS